MKFKFRLRTQSYSAGAFFQKRYDNKSPANNNKFIADRHANVDYFFSKLRRQVLFCFGTRKALERTDAAIAVKFIYIKSFFLRLIHI